MIIANPIIVTILLIMAIVWLHREKQYRSTTILLNQELRQNKIRLTQLSQQTMQLANDNELLRDVIDTPTNPIFVIDGDLKIIFANQATAEMFDVPLPDLISTPLSRLIADPEQLHKLQLDTQQVLSLSETSNITEFSIHDLRYNEQVYYSLNRRILHNSQHGVVVVATDITTMRQVMRLNHELQERYSRLVENSRNLVLQIDANMMITYANPACQEILGVSQAACLHKPWLDFIHPADQRKLRAQFGRWSFMTKRREEKRWEFRTVTPNGEVKNLLWSITVYWRESVFEGLQADAVDITEQKQTEVELQAAHEAERELNRKYQHLLSNYETALQTIIR